MMMVVKAPMERKSNPPVKRSAQMEGRRPPHWCTKVWQNHFITYTPVMSTMTAVRQLSGYGGTSVASQMAPAEAEVTMRKATASNRHHQCSGLPSHFRVDLQLGMAPWRT